MKLRKIFAARLQALMEERINLDTQVKVAAAAEMSQSSVGRFLKGSVSPTLDNLEALATVFEVPPTTLIHDPAHPSGMHGLDYQLKDLPADARRKVLEYADTIKKLHKADVITLEVSSRLDVENTRAIRLATGKKTVTNLRGKSVESDQSKKRHQY